MIVRFFCPYLGRQLSFRSVANPKKLLCYSGNGDSSSCLERFVGALAVVTYRFQARRNHVAAAATFREVVNVVAQSDDRFAGSSALGVGVDLATGVRLVGDSSLSGVFGDSSVAVVDGETAGATHSWRGPNDTLSARNLLTHLIPAGPFSYDVSARMPFDHGQAQTYRSPGPWPAGLLHAPGPGVLLLGGGVADDPAGAVIASS
jgi:hypothetical protein